MCTNHFDYLYSDCACPRFTLTGPRCPGVKFTFFSASAAFDRFYENELTLACTSDDLGNQYDLLLFFDLHLMSTLFSPRLPFAACVYASVLSGAIIFVTKKCDFIRAE